jgi:hypothetical protein
VLSSWTIKPNVLRRTRPSVELKSTGYFKVFYLASS